METAFLKYGTYGDAGSGKTYTLTRIAIGLHKYIKSQKPIAFVDSDKGSDFVIHKFKEAKIQLCVLKTKVFKTLVSVVQDKNLIKEFDIIIYESASQWWDELVESYKKKYNLQEIRGPGPWGIIKPMWWEFSDFFKESAIHSLISGRAGQIWEKLEDEETGIKELQMTGTKMRVEKELGYEPSLLVEMVKVKLPGRQGIINRAWVEKDRWDEINGKSFDMPGFEAFLPHISRLNIGGKHTATEGKIGDSREMYADRNTGYAKLRRKEQLKEEISNEVYKLYPGRDDKSKLDRWAITKKAFGTDNWEKIKDMHVEQLERGTAKLKVLIQVIRNSDQSTKKEERVK